MVRDANLIPVVIGVGQINDRSDTLDHALSPVDLMAQALAHADEDAGGGLLADCDSLAIVAQLGWPELNPIDARVAASLGITPRCSEQTPAPHGESPLRLLSEAANRIAAGEARICAVAGGEALRTAALRARDAADAPDGRRDALRDAPHRKREGYAQGFGLVVPTDVYPLYENAIRSAYGQTLAEAQRESGEIWASMSRVAADNSGAWSQHSVRAQDIIVPSAANRPIAFPYTKLQVANASVNQGAGFIVTSLAEARKRAVDPDRLVYIGHAAAAHESADFLARERYDASPGMAVTLTEALGANGLTTDDLAHVELYSCFPCIPKMARRVIGWPLHRPLTVFGGLTFGGGPIGNYMSHAVAAMVERLRGTNGKGLLFANGGYATYNHAVVLSGEPLDVSFPQDFDRQAMAEAARGPVPPVTPGYRGPAVLETYTVFSSRVGEYTGGVVVARTADGGRALAAIPAEDGRSIARLTQPVDDPVGAPGVISGGAQDRPVWTFA